MLKLAQNNVKYFISGGLKVSNRLYNIGEFAAINKITTRMLRHYDKIGDLLLLSQFKDKLDVNNMGVFGHSFGGATAGQVCAADKRFKAGINMDGSPFLIYDNLSQPFMLMTSSESKKSIIDGYHPKQELLIVAVNNAEHNDFTDMTILLSGLKRIGTDFLGKIDGEKQENIMNDYIVSFFNQYLKGINEPLIDNKIDKYPEVTTELR